jgi:fructose-1-phosphate kinase PfkB-like protein
VAVELAQFLGGPPGAMVADMLGAAVADASPAYVGEAPRAVVRQRTVPLLGPAQSTRTCVTLLDDAAGHEMTELVEPPAPVTDAQAEAMWQELEAGLAPALQGGVAPPLRAVALMGAVPPGAASLYGRVSAAVASAATAAAATAAARHPSATSAAPAAPAPWVLMDAVKDVLPALAAGGVHALKINADELAALAAEACPAAVPQGERDGSPAARCDGVRVRALALLRELRGTSSLRDVAVTDGPAAAHLVSARAGGAVHTVFALPPLPHGLAPVNPIGAGDTVAGVTVMHAALCGVPLAAAFARGLAAGSASCLTMRGGVWDAAHEDDVFAGVAAAKEEVFFGK